MARRRWLWTPAQMASLHREVVRPFDPTRFSLRGRPSYSFSSLLMPPSSPTVRITARWEIRRASMHCRWLRLRLGCHFNLSGRFVSTSTRSSNLLFHTDAARLRTPPGYIAKARRSPETNRRTRESALKRPSSPGPRTRTGSAVPRRKCV